MSAVERHARLEAHEPPEARGVPRDGVRLLVSSRRTGSIVHGRFRDLPRLLAPGDLLVVNTSATLPAAVPATRADGAELELRFSTPAPGRDPDSYWIVELRRGDEPFGAVEVGRGRWCSRPHARARILAPYAAPRLWLAHLDLPQPARDLPRRARATDSVRLRAAALAALRLPERLRSRDRKRRDAERGATLHARADHPARRRRRARRADHAACRRLLAGAPRASLPGTVPRPAADGEPGERRPSSGAGA